MKEIVFSVVPYASCVNDVIAFRNANRELTRDSNYFEWRYERRPCPRKALIVWGVDPRGRRIAAASLIPHDFHVLDGVYPVGLLGDISVAPEYRGRGIGTRMFQFLRQEPALEALRACLVLPNDEATRSLERSGWRQVTTIARLVKIVDAEPRLRARLGDSRWATVLARLINSFGRYTSKDGWYRQQPSYRTVLTDEFDRGFDELWSALPKDGRVLALRDRRYLNWRYREHPVVRYYKIEARLGENLHGYVIFHVAEDVAVVDDFLALNDSAGSWLIQQFLNHVRHGNLATDIHVRYNADSLYAMPWGRFGFLRRRDFQRVMVSVPESGGFSDLPSTESHWFVTAGDKDV